MGSTSAFTLKGRPVYCVSDSARTRLARKTIESWDPAWTDLRYQLSMVLRAQRVRAESITQYTGLPFKVSELADRIREAVREHSGKLAAV